MHHKKVLGIVGLPYCGSTVIQYILNSHPQIKSFGEIYHIGRDVSESIKALPVTCSECGDRPCPVFHGIPWAGDIYDILYKRSDPSTQLLVDSSKSVPWYEYLDEKGISNQYEMRYLYLVREPLSWAHSFVKHQGVSYDEALEKWLEGDDIIRSYLRAKPFAIFLDYKEFADELTRNALLAFLGVSILQLNTEHYHTTPIHQVGGNETAFYGKKPFMAVTEQKHLEQMNLGLRQRATAHYKSLSQLRPRNIKPSQVEAATAPA